MRVCAAQVVAASRLSIARVAHKDELGQLQHDTI